MGRKAVLTRKENMGHIREGEKVLLFTTSFFCIFPPAPVLIIFSLGPLLYIYTDLWHVFFWDSHCIGEAQKRIFAPTRKEEVQDSMSLVTQHRSRVHPTHTLLLCPAAGDNNSLIIPNEKSSTRL